MAHDFNQVRLHTGPAAAEAARAAGATAFTVGKHIVFGSGQYAPATERGRQLLRHELAHTIQQPGGEPPSNLQYTNPSDRFEVEAERVASGRGTGWVAVQRSSLPMLARQQISSPAHPSATSHRNISITIGGSPVGQTVTFSYPVPESGNLYVVPLYDVTVTGTDDAGRVVTETFKALRFGVYFDPAHPVGTSKATGPFVAGRATHQEYTAGFRSDYSVHSAVSDEPGAWDLNGGFLIHDGPDFPIDPAKLNLNALGAPTDPSAARNNLYATIGCIEITGAQGFTRFNDLIIKLSGSKLSGVAALNDIANHGLVKVTYVKASRPQLRRWKPSGPGAPGTVQSP